MNLRSASAACLFLGSLILVAGCVDDGGLGKRYKVTGKVTYNGAPLKGGSVNFYPDDVATGQPAVGVIQPDGSYTLGTRGADDGALAGKYKISITAEESDASKTGVPGQGGSQDQVTVGKARGKSLIPVKYTGIDQSGLTAEVSSGSTKFDFALKD